MKLCGDRGDTGGPSLREAARVVAEVRGAGTALGKQDAFGIVAPRGVAVDRSRGAERDRRLFATRFLPLLE